MTKLEREMLNYYKHSLELYEARLEVLKKPYKKSEVQLMSAERDLVRKKIKEFKLKIGELVGTDVLDVVEREWLGETILRSTVQCERCNFLFDHLDFQLGLSECPSCFSKDLKLVRQKKEIVE